MWVALFAFHISQAQGSAELSMCSVCKRTVRPLAVVLLTPVVEGSAHIIGCGTSWRSGIHREDVHGSFRRVRSAIGLSG